MKTPLFKPCSALVSLIVCALFAPQSHAQSFTQTITLQPGWNAVWLEVQPDNNRTEMVFSNLPLAGAWTRLERLSSADFIQNVSEAAFNEAGWQHWFPASREEAFLNDLFTIQANHAYLLKCTNATPVVWNITGRPSLRRPAWTPDAYNLRGVPVDPSAPPTFLNFFRHSPAHYDSSSNQLRKIYRLNSATGQWQIAGANELLESGRAYWIFTEGASDYLAPLDVQVDFGDGLDFGADLTELNLRVKNLKSTAVNALVRDVAGPSNSILSSYTFNSSTGGQWPALPTQLVVPSDAGVKTRIRLAARRQDQTTRLYQSIIEVRDGAGTLLRVPVSVENPAAPASGSAAAIGGPVAADAFDNPLAGLWVGSATLKAISEPHSTDPSTPTPTKSELGLRLLVHVDATGQARLLKEVLQMWRNGTFTNDGSGNLVVDKPGQYVLLTDDTLIPLFEGATVRDGESVGRRISTIGYDFPSSSSNNFLNLTGTFAIGQSLTGTLTLPYDHPNNPFKHKYHPDHDNLNAQFNGPAMESFTTTRAIQLDFAATPPDGPAVPDFGYNEMGGTYKESITGIHKNIIYVSGTFRLSRVSRIAELNPSPTP
jgi:hypothetical protein